MKYFLKRFELKAISRVAIAAINEHKNKRVADQEDGKYNPAIIPIEAGTVMKMLREIEHRRQQSYADWCKRMAAQKKEQK